MKGICERCQALTNYMYERYDGTRVMACSAVHAVVNGANPVVRMVEFDPFEGQEFATGTGQVEREVGDDED